MKLLKGLFNITNIMRTKGRIISRYVNIASDEGGLKVSIAATVGV